MKEVWIWLKPADYKRNEEHIIQDWWLKLVVDDILKDDTFSDLVNRSTSACLVLDNVTENKTCEIELDRRTAHKFLKAYSNLKVEEWKQFDDVHIFEIEKGGDNE
jgi:hypothetical protein